MRKLYLALGILSAFYVFDMGAIAYLSTIPEAATRFPEIAGVGPVLLTVLYLVGIVEIYAVHFGIRRFLSWRRHKA
jgi:hypothetical protein